MAKIRKCKTCGGELPTNRWKYCDDICAKKGNNLRSKTWAKDNYDLTIERSKLWNKNNREKRNKYNKKYFDKRRNFYNNCKNKQEEFDFVIETNTHDKYNNSYSSNFFSLPKKYNDKLRLYLSSINKGKGIGEEVLWEEYLQRIAIYFIREVILPAEIKEE